MQRASCTSLRHPRANGLAVIGEGAGEASLEEDLNAPWLSP